MNNDMKRKQKESTERKKEKNTFVELIFSNSNNLELLKFASNSIFLTFQGASECNIWDRKSVV